MITEDINALMHELHRDKTADKISRIFGYERKWLYNRQFANSFVVNDKFIAGLNSLGYELVLRKKENNESTNQP